ncbi:MAG: hypothetical protein II919_09525 [Lachnospiraceae bacterium]|nr:hypothetical protein [Lachnospiraceae bacterium]
MKKHIVKRAVVLSIAAAVAMTSFTGCGSKKKEKNASARKVVKYDINDYVTLGQYTGLDINEEIQAVTDADIQSSLDSIIEDQTTFETVTDRNVVLGDKVIIDYTRIAEGQDDVVQADFEMTVGNQSLGEEFDEKLIDLATGANISFTLEETKYDEETGEAGTIEATYNVSLKEIQQAIIPEVTDAFIADHTEYDTLEAYKEGKRKELEEANEKNAKNTTESELLQRIVDASEVSGCPAFIYNMNYNSLVKSYEMYASYSGADLETYLGYSGKTMDDLKLDAVEATKQTLVVEAIAKAAGIDITDEQLEAKLNEYVEDYDSFNSKEDVLKAISREEILFDMRGEAAINYIYENNNINQVIVSNETELSGDDVAVGEEGSVVEEETSDDEESSDDEENLDDEVD